MRTYFLLAIIITVILCGCLKKDIDIIPEAELTAEISNRDWLADTIESSYSDGVLNITGTTKKGTQLNLRIHGLNLTTYILRPSSTHTADYKTSLEMTNTYNSSAHPNAGGYVKITSIDEERGLVSGQFFLILFQNQTYYSVEISRGEFKNVSYLEPVTIEEQ